MRIENQQVHLSLLTKKGLELWIKREDLIHPFVSGNKFRKLKYNLKAAKARQSRMLLTFGGAYSNHLAATAHAAKLQGLKSIGIVRGEELITKWQHNPTLHFASEQGMRFHFVSRETYRNKTSASFLNALTEKFGDYYLIPEGGTNEHAVAGCEEILTEADAYFQFICSCVGTGGTLAGIINSSREGQQVLGFPALKGDFLKEDIRKFAQKTNWELQNTYHFGGYAKVNASLVHFINDFKKSTGIPLDPVYTGKMMYGILDLVKNDFFASGTKILAVHTGGLQGIPGMNAVLKKKNLPQLHL